MELKNHCEQESINDKTFCIFNQVFKHITAFEKKITRNLLNLLLL